MAAGLTESPKELIPSPGDSGHGGGPVGRLFDGSIWWVLLGFLAIVLTFFPLRGGEFLTRLATGRALAQGTMALGQEPFSYALKDVPWVHGSWLFDRILYLGWQLDGGNGKYLVAVKTGVFALLSWLILFSCGKGVSRQLVAPLMVGVLLVAVSGQADLGPHLATLFLFPVVLLLLGKVEKSGGSLSWVFLASFFALFCLWANSDSGFVFGLAGLALWLLADLPAGGKNLLSRGAVLGISLLGTLVNPFLWKIYQMPDTLGFFPGAVVIREDGRFYLNYLGSFQEWFISAWNLSFLPLPALGGLLLCLIGLFVLGGKFIQSGQSGLLWRLLVLAGLFLLGLAKHRLVGLGAVAAAVFLAEYLSDLDHSKAGEEWKGRAWLARLIAASCLAGLTLVGAFTTFLRPSAKSAREFGWGYVWSEGMRDLALRLGEKGQKNEVKPLDQRERLLVVENAQEMASYLLWFAPQYAQFLDGRWARCGQVLEEYKNLVSTVAITSGSDNVQGGEPAWRKKLEDWKVQTVVANLMGESLGASVAFRFSNLSDWESPFLAGGAQVAKLRIPPERDQQQSIKLVNNYFDRLVLEATQDSLEWREGELDQPVRAKNFWEFWQRKPTISGKSIEADIRSKLAGQYRRYDARVGQALLALRQARVAVAEKPNNPGGLLICLQCLGQLSDSLAAQQEKGLLADLVELELITLAQRVLDLANDLEDERSDNVRTARMVLFQVGSKRGFVDLMEEQGKALLQSRLTNTNSETEDTRKYWEGLEDQVGQVGKKRAEMEDKLVNALDRMRSGAGGREPPQFFKAITALEFGLPLRAMRELQSPETMEQVKDSEQSQITATLLTLQLALQLGRVDEVRAVLDGPGKQLLDRTETVKLTHPGVLLPQLLNRQFVQMDNRSFPLYDWLLIQSQVAAGRYKEAVDGMEKLADLKQELLKASDPKNSRSKLVLLEGPYGALGIIPGARDQFRLSSEVLGAAANPGIARILNPLVHELAGAYGEMESANLRQTGILAELQGVCGYYAAVAADGAKARKFLNRSLVQSLNLAFVTRALVRASVPIHPVSPLVQEIYARIAEGSVPSWHSRLGWVRILDSVMNLNPQAAPGF